MRFIHKFLLITALLSSSHAFGQLTEDPDERRDKGKDPFRTQTPEGRPLPFAQRLRFGGGISNLRIGNPFSIGLSPVVAYQASERLIVGVGANYVYTRFKPGYYYANQGVTITQYGGRGFVMYEFIPSIISNLYLHGELQTNYYQQKTDKDKAAGSVTPPTVTGSVTAPLVGLTYMQPISRRFGVNITALYNLNYDANDPISNQIYNGSPFVLRLAFF